MLPKQILERFNQADEARRTAAMARLRTKAAELAVASSIDDATIEAIERAMSAAGVDRQTFFRIVAAVHQIKQLRGQLATETELCAAYEQASRDVENAESELRQVGFSGFEDDNVRRAILARRDLAQRQRGEAESASRLLKLRREELLKLEKEFGLEPPGHVKVLRATLGFALAAGRV